VLLKARLLFALSLAVACAEKPPEPELVCVAPRRDFGRVLEGERLVHVFRLENPGASPLVVGRVDGGYACKPVSVPSEVPPQKSATLEVVCETSGHPARLFERLAVRSNARRPAPLELQLKAEITPLLAFETSLVELGTRFGAPVERRVAVAGALAERGRLEVLEVSQPGIEAKVVSDGAPAVVLRLPASAVGRGAGHVRVATGLDHPRELTLPYSFEVRGNLVVDPERPYVNLRLPAPHEVSFTVTSSRDDFALASVEVTKGPFEARFEKRAPRSFEVRVRVKDGDRPKETSFSGEVVLNSNDPFEPQKVAPVFALGVANPG
jgi:hypothetical protein